MLTQNGIFGVALVDVIKPLLDMIKSLLDAFGCLILAKSSNNCNLTDCMFVGQFAHLVAVYTL